MELQALHSLVLFFSMLDRQQPHAWDFADGLDVAVSGGKKKNPKTHPKKPGKTAFRYPVKNSRA